MMAVQMARWKCATEIVDALVNRGSPSTDHGQKPGKDGDEIGY